MATYEDLRAYFDNSETMTALAKQTSQIDIVRGYALDVDPLWLLADDIEQGFVPREQLDNFYQSYWRQRGFNFHGEFARWSFQGYRRRDLKRSVGLWGYLRSSLGLPELSGPVIMTIIHGPLRTPVLHEGTKRDDTESLRRLVALVAESTASARLEERPHARLALVGGDGVVVGGTKSGTYGGTLYDLAGKALGMTCAHVAAAGDAVSDQAGSKIGSCRADTTLVSLSTGSVCDPVVLAAPNPSPGNGPAVNMLDLALVDLLVTPSGPTLGGVAASYNRPGCYDRRRCRAYPLQAWRTCHQLRLFQGRHRLLLS